MHRGELVEKYWREDLRKETGQGIMPSVFANAHLSTLGFYPLTEIGREKDDHISKG